MLLTIADLRIELPSASGAVSLVDGVSIGVDRGRTVALVGESGCGKSLTSLAALRLLPAPLRIAGGEIIFDGRDLLVLAESDMRTVRGRRIAMIFQEPMTSLNPVLSVGEQIAEPLMVHEGLSRRESLSRATELLARVGIREPRQRIHDYPHQMSGGMRQRVMIAMAIACGPDVLIADEPTTALDVTVQRQILDLMRELQRVSGLGILFITHDLALVSEFADEVNVMYAGRIVERGPAATVLGQPRHPYTQALLRSAPTLDGRTAAATRTQKLRLPVIPGDVPRPERRPSGCAFHPRCDLGRDELRCRVETQALSPLAADHECACWKAS